jgi:hypothetical protein
MHAPRNVAKGALLAPLLLDRGAFRLPAKAAQGPSRYVSLDLAFIG